MLYGSAVVFLKKLSEWMFVEMHIYVETSNDMRISVQQWRASIGRWTTGGVVRSNINSAVTTSPQLYLLLVLLVLLVIGGVEMNPGPVQTFNKMKGFADISGSHYEIKMSALLFLRAIQTREEFQIASNMESADLSIISTGGKLFCFSELFDSFPTYKTILSAAVSSENVTESAELLEVVQKLCQHSEGKCHCTVSWKQSHSFKSWRVKLTSRVTLLAELVPPVVQLAHQMVTAVEFLQQVILESKCRMLAEVFCDDADHFCRTGEVRLPPSLDVLLLYEQFIDKKLRVHFEKLYGNLVKTVMLQMEIDNKKHQGQDKIGIVTHIRCDHCDLLKKFKFEKTYCKIRIFQFDQICAEMWTAQKGRHKIVDLLLPLTSLDSTDVESVICAIERVEEEKKTSCESYERRNVDLETKIKNLEEEMKHLLNSNNNNKVYELECENQELKERLQETCDEISQLHEQVRMICTKNQELQREIAELQEINCMQKQELSANTNIIETLREEQVFLKSELDSLKNRPQDDKKRGNSIFAEVEDKRQSMKKTLENAVLKYRKMKKHYAEKCSEVSKLKADFVYMSEKCEEIETDMKKEDLNLIESYKSHIKILEKQIEELKNSKPIVFPNDDKAAFKSMQTYVEFCRKEKDKVKCELEDQYMKALFSNETLHTAQRELHKMEVRLMQSKAKITQLEAKIQENQGRSDEEIDLASIE
ncbi:hypothetical protein L9F63_012510 [Diploptera punctata]|uniref:Uncharacterized protein n=1 Tax=Diploptera punctata TaxID=6984 RepID=A0AAD8ENB2_DIPPU|nr:hypothetical protein L9F63_012510 [Diploptera punctata]